jgi:hypothetical protein
MHHHSNADKQETADSNLLLLLQLIKHDGTISMLLKRGLEYSQIAHLILKVKEDKLIEERKGKLIVIDKGELKIDNLNRKYGRKGHEAWISPAVEYRVPKIDPSAVYLPEDG